MDDTVERGLIVRFQSGDLSAYSELFESNHRRVLNLGLRMLRNEESALDVAQEVFMRAYEELPNWRGEARFSTWLYRTALNVCFERIRAEEKQRRIRDRSPEEELTPSPEINLSANEVRSAIDKAIKTLPSRQQTIFVLKQYEELRFSEIAGMLEITEGGAKASYHKALMALRERLKEWAPNGVRAGESEKLNEL
ncbi:MAG TPA: RNA polymerase sigma factor [Planctomycetota bacterium]|nr:RNA polymerase sigma factor [Planctomycetota bacterium]